MGHKVCIDLMLFSAIYFEREVPKMNSRTVPNQDNHETSLPIYSAIIHLFSLIRVAVATEVAAINLKVTEARTVAAGVEVNNKVVMAAETLVEAMVLHRLVS